MTTILEGRRRKVTDIHQYQFKRPINEQNDTEVINFLYNCLKFTGLTPCSLEHPYIIYKLLFFLPLAAIIGQIYYCLSIWSYVVADISSDILFKVGLGVNIPFAAICSAIANFQVQPWKEFTRSVRTLERYVTECGFRHQTRRVFYYILIVGIYLIFSIELTVYLNYRMTEGLWFRIKQTVVWMLFYLYRISVWVYLTCVVHFVRRRYIYVTAMLSEEETMEENVKKAMRICEMVRLTMKCVNRIFGLHLFFAVAGYVITVLAVVSNVIVTGDIVISGTYFLGGHTISLVVLVMSCEALEKSGQKIIKTCYMLHETVGDELVKQDLLLLATYAEQWKPALSAAGFYDLNQKTLSTLFEAIITYLVIIIQFNLALV